MIIEKFNFGNADYSALRQNPEFLRTFELQAIMGAHRHRVFKKILEIGCGRGLQSRLLKNYGDEVIATDANEVLLPKHFDEPGLTFKRLDAQNMNCFDDRQFDLILSSNLIEHLPCINECLSECHRVLKADGVVIHTVPNTIWKILHLLLFYPVRAKQLGRKVMRLSNSANHPATSSASCNNRHLDDNLRQMETHRLINRIIPKPHGRCHSHIDEFLEWRQRAWIARFTRSGYIVQRIVHLPFYYGHGLEFEAVHRLGNTLGLSGSTAYVLSIR